MTEGERNTQKSKRINFDEPIVEMIGRLKKEHEIFISNLDEIDENIGRKDRDIAYAAKIARSMNEPVLRHAVEEEARLLRVIMEKAKDESSESIKIMQEHNWVMDFFKNKLTSVEKSLNGSVNEDITNVNKGILEEFVVNMKTHFSEEERVVFPLVLGIESRR